MPRLPRPGATLVVPALGRYGRSLQDLITMADGLHLREIGFTSLHEVPGVPGRPWEFRRG
ncbi:hypothetical protein ACFW7J_06730 [Streptomyces sp. NPDC059525]|uniref:hypothetical protein n=1 Tax=Streptomyces sp. NPDC059525 TaxID=3346857 RepID=UPI0036A42002